MSKSIQTLLAVLVVVLGVSTAVLFTRYRKTTDDFAASKASEESVQKRYAQTIDAIAEIQDSLNTISLGDANVQMLSKELQSEQHLSGADSREALDRIATLRASIMRNKNRIRELEASVKLSGVKVAGLQRMVNNLKDSVAEKEALVADLSSRVDALQTQVTGLTTEVAENQDTIRARDEAIEDKRKELATVMYIVGTKHELQVAGAVVAKGGVLGLGKTLQPTGDPKEEMFNALDTDHETVIPTPAAKAVVLTPQPTTSYELVAVNGKMELHILDPVAFRKVRRLVILTT